MWCPKYRRKVIEAAVDDRLQQIIRDVCAERDARIIELETMPDHVHLLVSCDPQYGIHRLVKQIKARWSRYIRQEFPAVRSRIPTLWTNSYFVLDELLLRRHRRRDHDGDRQAVPRQPAQRMNGTPIPPHG